METSVKPLWAYPGQGNEDTSPYAAPRTLFIVSRIHCTLFIVGRSIHFWKNKIYSLIMNLPFGFAITFLLCLIVSKWIFHLLSATCEDVGTQKVHWYFGGKRTPCGLHAFEDW
jgi:hypothetical protein